MSSTEHATKADIERLTAAMAKHFDDQLAKLVEALDDRIVYHVKPLAENMANLQSDIRVIKAAVTAHSHELHDLDRRTSQLEARP